MTQNTPAGWFPDPQQAGQLRYWDGNAWTDHRAPMPSQSIPAPPPVTVPGAGSAGPVQPLQRKRAWYTRKRFLLPVAFLVLVVIFAPKDSETSNDKTVAADASTQVEKTTSAPAKPSVTPTPTPTPISKEEAARQAKAEAAAKKAAEKAAAEAKAKARAEAKAKAAAEKKAKIEAAKKAAEAKRVAAAKAAKAARAAELEDAIGSAEDYIGYQAFSRKGLIEQLRYEGYPANDATEAVDSLNINYNQQAVKAAKAYLDFSHFSRQGLIEQLEYEGYTPSQARAGANGAGR